MKNLLFTQVLNGTMYKLGFSDIKSYKYQYVSVSKCLIGIEKIGNILTKIKLTMKFVAEETSAWVSYKSGQFDVFDTVPKSDIQGALKDESST